jgi:hypothetical protein
VVTAGGDLNEEAAGMDMDVLLGSNLSRKNQSFSHLYLIPLIDSLARRSSGLIVVVLVFPGSICIQVSFRGITITKGSNEWTQPGRKEDPLNRGMHWGAALLHRVHQIPSRRKG